MYLEIDEGFPGHRKTLKLCSLLCDPQAGWYMIRLWTWACRSCKNGSLLGMSPADIEMAVQYRPLDGACYKAMAAAGYVDENAPGEPSRIHDWMSPGGTGYAIARAGRYNSIVWKRNRLLALARDKVCVECGGEADLGVHHRKPARLFDGEDAAHELDNLVTLCRPDHDAADVLFRETGEIYAKKSQD